MRIRRFLYCLMVAVLILLRIVPSAGHKAFRPCRIKGRVFKRMIQPRSIYADFAALGDAGGGSGGGGGGGGGGAAGSGGGKSECKNVPEASCNVNSIFTPGDPKQKSSIIAIKAAQEAKAANEAQSEAGAAAAQHIKQELADKAYQFAKAAEAALTGKQMVVEQLEQEIREAEAVVTEEGNSLQNTETNMNAAVNAARAATQQYEALSFLQKTAQENLANIQTVAMGSQQEMTSKTQLLEAAKNRLQQLEKQLNGAREDYEKTKQAAYKAACAAVEAKQKASSRARRCHRQRPATIFKWR